MYFPMGHPLLMLIHHVYCYCIFNCLGFIISPYLISHSSDLQSNPGGSPRVSVWVEIGNHLWIIGLYDIVDHHDGFVPQYILTKPSRAAGISTFVGNRMQVVLHKAVAEVSK